MNRNYESISSISGYGYTKPNKNSNSIIKWYDNKKKALVVTREFCGNKIENKCTRLSKEEYFDKRLNQKRKYSKKHKRCKDRTKAFGRLGFANRLILCNFEGNEAEILIKLSFNKKIKDIKLVTKLSNAFLTKLKKRLAPIIYIKVWKYNDLHWPECHLWIKTIDNSKIEILQSTLEDIWKENGIVTYSRKYIKFEEEEQIIYGQLIDKLEGFETQNQTTKRIFVNINSKQEEIMRISYETFYKAE